MAMRKVFVIPLISAAVLTLTGCNTSPMSDAGEMFPVNSLANRWENDTAQVFDVAGPIAIDIESFNGDVTVQTNPSASTATVKIQREGTHGFSRSKEAKASLGDIQYSVEMAPPGEGGIDPVLTIRTWTTHSEPHFQRAHVTIEAPAVDGIHVHTHRGDVEAHGIEGAVDITTDAGDVRLTTRLPMTKAISIVNREGDIDYRVRGESTGSFDCRSIHGKVDMRARHGRVRIMPGRDARAMLATLNEGENSVQMRTVDGDIRVAIVSDPEGVGTWIITP
jgi:DUF4097 and DUF4098 domain-containing protein YvlB